RSRSAKRRSHRRNRSSGSWDKLQTPVGAEAVIVHRRGWDVDLASWACHHKGLATNRPSMAGGCMKGQASVGGARGTGPSAFKIPADFVDDSPTSTRHHIGKNALSKLGDFHRRYVDHGRRTESRRRRRARLVTCPRMRSVVSCRKLLSETLVEI